jgi:hypothetical protein
LDGVMRRYSAFIALLYCISSSNKKYGSSFF